MRSIRELAQRVRKITDPALLQATIVNQNIQHAWDQAVNTGVWLTDAPFPTPFIDGRVPCLDFYDGEIYVDLAPFERKYVLLSQAPSDNARLLTQAEQCELMSAIEYLISMPVEELPDSIAVHESIDTLVQKFGMESHAPAKPGLRGQI